MWTKLYNYPCKKFVRRDYMTNYICEIYHHNNKIGTLNGKLIETEKETYLQISDIYKIYKYDKIKMKTRIDSEYPEVIYVKVIKQSHTPDKLEISYYAETEFISLVFKIFITLMSSAINLLSLLANFLHR